MIGIYKIINKKIILNKNSIKQIIVSIKILILEITMGKIQCVSIKENNDLWEKIEKDLEKKSTYFERALLNEYKDIKLMLEYSGKVYIINDIIYIKIFNF